MSKFVFKLPDLGEGLYEAEIADWHVEAGKEVREDDDLVTVETDKAAVEVPSPVTGKVTKLCGEPGDVVSVGEPLAEFEIASGSEVSEEDSETEPPRADAGTVVGTLETSNETLEESGVVIGSQQKRLRPSHWAMPKVQNVANRFGLNIETLEVTGKYGQVNSDALKKGIEEIIQGETIVEKLTGVRRNMSLSMTSSHQQVVPVTIFDKADIHAWQANTDITCRLLRAIARGCVEQPGLNSWYDGETLVKYIHKKVNIGIAADGNNTLLLPVIKNVAARDPKDLRACLEELKKDVRTRKVKPSALKGATIALTNFGMFAGQYATPIIVAPMVAIIGAGRLHESAVVIDGKVEAHRVMPISLSFDHRALTGAEVTKFLAIVIKDLEKSE